ncbi:MAG: hypothetical protein B6D34_12455 [Candidatus Brocadia sp. UTAMX1]|jgi:hypothetical protein|nr:MAG: hypothetical protein B6D34_12455 [Candidatus Brocadia sp. UTAMX1]
MKRFIVSDVNGLRDTAHPGKSQEQMLAMINRLDAKKTDSIPDQFIGLYISSLYNNNYVK